MRDDRRDTMPDCVIEHTKMVHLLCFACYRRSGGGTPVTMGSIGTIP